MNRTDRPSINSTRNPRVKAAISLQKKRDRDRLGLIIVEGTREVARALEAGMDPVEAFVCTSVSEGPAIEDIAVTLAAKGSDLFEVSPVVYGKLAYRRSTEGVVAVFKKPEESLSSFTTRQAPLYLVVDGVEKPGNLGAVFRSADGAGVDGIIVTGKGTDLYNPNVIRASLGTVFDIHSAVATATEAMRWLKERKIRTIVATPAAEHLYHEADLTSQCAIVVGSEDRGASREYIDSADQLVRLPMRGIADSLNVSVSASILVYESLRQRTIAGRKQ
ncbi:MAG: RNA methyltransferase [Candidatus Krumholzibacteria bacterium]|nr:RNA methyltransferase [Candidatus Krumholzibacteria bacterium]